MLLRKIVKHYSLKARSRRAIIFKEMFFLDKNTKILDLGSADGSAINTVLKGTKICHKNVYIADIDAEMVEIGQHEYGFVPIVIKEDEGLPFENCFFDIVYCSSAIEHVTVPKDKVWNSWSGYKFKRVSQQKQKEFSEEIRRLGKQYFVQTPNRYFPIESHSWLPLMAWLPRWLLIFVLHVTNLFWIKQTNPDWHLLDKKALGTLFFDAEIVEEEKFWLLKSLMAVKSNK